MDLAPDLLPLSEDHASTRRECLAAFTSVLVPDQRDTGFIYKELPYIICYVYTCLLYAIASRGFTARFNSVDKTNRLSAIREREWIRRDMRYFCKEMVNPATIPRSLFYCLTQLCRGIDAGEIDSVHIRHATWAEIRNYLLTPLGEPPITFELYREAICPFLWSYIDGDPAIPTESAQASTSTTTTAQTSHVPPASPQPSHAETRTATTPGRNLPPLPLPEDYKS